MNTKLEWVKNWSDDPYCQIDLTDNSYIYISIDKTKNMYDFKISLNTARRYGIESTERNRFDIYDSPILYDTIEQAQTVAEDYLKYFLNRKFGELL